MNLKELRLKESLTQDQIAKIIGVKQQTYNGYENNKFQPDISTLIKLADYFNVSIDYLVERRQNNKIDLSNLTETQKSIINMAIKLNETNANKIESYIIAKLEEQEDYKQENIFFKKEK